ncbi:MAG: DNA/RNA nuclease SfsA [Candidatus Cellulosilyticum pullistercoris]|uniref:Sugar fermentation stimulation protein homolog n=1 Tax=Candidatus Cellulosilyticum pullistercoris TaxID=2838521 RepID=A0A9E2NK35_9FIRM|nr:DNA/RNA nuclease SfsA [Candidatus Cellulosilyticum pullistercoris]
MKYKKIIKAIFIERPNRFIAYCQIAGEVHKVHVKNTGRCKELLVPGVIVYLEESDNPNRKTKYSLIAVEKGNLLINMDSQVPNQVVEEALRTGKIKLPGITEPFTWIKREKTYGQSRFDFYIETLKEKIFIEVKGVTLEEEGIVRFPDAPTQRGVKHIEELVSATKEGYKCYVLFVVQMAKARYFTPHEAKHPEFAKALVSAAQNGVGILAYTCEVAPDTLVIDQPLEVKL